MTLIGSEKRFKENIEIRPCIPNRKTRKKAVKYDKRRYKRRNRIEIKFGRLKDWRRVATRHDRCPTTSAQLSCMPQRCCSGYEIQ